MFTDHHLLSFYMYIWDRKWLAHISFSSILWSIYDYFRLLIQVLEYTAAFHFKWPYKLIYASTICLYTVLIKYRRPFPSHNCYSWSFISILFGSFSPAKNKNISINVAFYTVFTFNRPCFTKVILFVLLVSLRTLNVQTISVGRPAFSGSPVIWLFFSVFDFAATINTSR